ncbi:unnamed protein product [Mycena citricolor]|uniref:Cyclin N-terminal domain-containing protein n=1 Tax=Mycena citricolor TaxID=2018698 RepID=A0AAD2K4C5_9AGAR|nr:unnamed protein product [Mycena citricolor]
MSSTVDYSTWSPASSTSSGSPVHPASLVDPTTHSSAILQLVDMEFTQSVIDYIVECIVETVTYALTRDSDPHSAITLGPSPTLVGKFTLFVKLMLSRAEVSPATVFVALAYVARARPHLAIASPEWALERVFLGALVVASKYTQDSTLRNAHWALCSGVFGKRDVGRVEREFLEVLNWDLGVREEEILMHWGGVMGLPDEDMPPVATPAAAATRIEITPAPESEYHGTGVPTLEPSSPSSTYSSSPRTPSTTDMDVDQPAPHAKKYEHEHGHHRHHSRRLSGLLRVLHVPHIHLPHHHHRASIPIAAGA